MKIRVFEKDTDDYWLRSLSISVAGHVLVGLIIIFQYLPHFNDYPEPIIYSVSIDGGATLGGKAQVAKDDKKSPLSPVKNVKAEEELQQQQQVKPDTKKHVEKEPPPEDAEVSIADKKPTPAPKATPVKVPSKATATPKSNDKKNDAKAKQKSDGDEVDKRLQAAIQRYTGESTDAGGKGFGAGKIGGQGMGGGVVRPPEFFAYERLLKSRIKDAWRWYDTNTALITVVIFDISPDGEVRRVSVDKSSGDESFDESVYRAVVKASPLPPPPEKVYNYFKSVRITFDPREMGR